MTGPPAANDRRADQRAGDQGAGDQRLAEAVGNWRARFLENGVNPSDYGRVTSSVTEWSGWLDAWSALAEVHESLGREALAHGLWRSAGGHLSQAALYYHIAKFFWVDDIIEMRRTHAHAVSCLMDALPHLDPPGRERRRSRRGPPRPG